MDKYVELEVDVNGEEIFIVDARVLSSYSGRIKRILGKPKGVYYYQKVIFHDFPGGSSNFELIARFCYNNGRVDINPLNLSTITCAAYFMEMDEFITGTENLCQQVEKSLEEIKYWTWSELLVSLKQCQELLPGVCSFGTLAKCLDCLVKRLASSCETSSCPSTSSPDSFGFRFSCDTRSTDGPKNNFFRDSWWFEDLVAFNTRLIEMIVKSMVSRNFDNGSICRFLLFYQKSRFPSASMDDKIRIMEMVVETLYSLGTQSVSYKSLFWILRLSMKMDISQCCRAKIESMIGSRLDEATLDNLLLRSPIQRHHLYDVNLVLKFFKYFVGTGVCCMPLSRLKKVARLVDLYLLEVAPDPHLKPLKFLALINALPDYARDSCDEVYYALNLYFEVHSGLSEEQKMEVCFGLNYEKLSPEAVNHLSRNTKFPSKSAIHALFSQQCKSKRLLQDTNPAPLTDSPLTTLETSRKGTRDDSADQQIVLCVKKLDGSDENKKIRAHLQGMHWRVMELENDCRNMQIQMEQMVKSGFPNHAKAKSGVPKLCSYH
ncbi:BTB/POZ domain-containing protein-like [Dorcoceras hygrometricum]|uniref:BTB/POZ domain-containing protein-like n=1 Tax=Dorcoceras hygrometricum TaxID=472368 RepID=A0A2Z7A0X5_9LAMI|nr:BTB/POZ domain-containing protein-like [Dorcoceras hygrometricum]